ncbi:MAG: hypothetical protein KDA81_08075 [Planctomycetaceae bacterium]|nr:hypothetical protein [Planctomycetaceae bacterium]
MTANWEAFTEKTIDVAEVRLLGLVDFRSLLMLQKLMVHEVRLQSRLSAAVLLCEHPAVVTSGSDSSILDLPADARELDALSIRNHRVHREGGTVFHQPGQLAVYVIVSLAECGFGENEFRWRLQDAIIAGCSDAQVTAQRDSGDPDVIIGRHGLICETAIGIDRGVTTFGAFLNVNCRLDQAVLFGRGLRGRRISSVNAERVRPVPMSQVRASMARHVCEFMGYPEYHLHTGHPFLRRSQQLANNVAHQDSDD